MIEVIRDKCVGCELCLKACAYDAIVIKDKIAEIDMDKCTLCGACVSACPFDAIIIRKFGQEAIERSQFKDIWIFAEQKNNEISPVVFELLGKGRELADQRECELVAVLMGYNIENLSNELIAFGADKVIVADDPKLKDFLDLPYARALTKLANKYKPEIILSGASVMGRSFIPRVAVELHTGLTADCTGLEIDPDTSNLLQTRPAFGGNILATIVTPNHLPQMATVRHKVMDPLERDDSREGTVIKESIDFTELKDDTKYLEFVKDESQTINLVEADLVVTGGRGLKSKDNFVIIEDLAKVLNGAVGASKLDRQEKLLNPKYILQLEFPVQFSIWQECNPQIISLQLTKIQMLLFLKLQI